MYEFERKTIGHPIYHVSELNIDVLRGQLFLALVFDRDLDSEKVAVEITFSNCQQISIEYIDDTDDNPLSYLLGIINKSEADGTQYIITCHIAEVSFISNSEPVTTWYDKTPLDMPYHPETLKMPDDTE